MLAALLPILGSIGTSVAKSLFPNPEDELKRRELEQRLQLAAMDHAASLEKAAATNIQTEAASSHWLAANWRPLTALIFVGLIVARWLGWTAPGMTEAEYLEVYDIIKVMIGGYVVSRGLEKVAPHVAGALPLPRRKP